MSYKSLWQGRIDSEDGDAGRRWHQVVEFQDTPYKAAGGLCLVGYPNDSGVEANKGRIGAAQGPDALRQAMANLPWILAGKLFDIGNCTIHCELAETQQDYASRVSEALRANKVLGLGGGHDIAWASYQGLNKATDGIGNIGIINFDAHLDLRKPAPSASSGTPFRQIAEFSQRNNKPFHYACLGASLAANTPALLDYARTTGTRMLPDTQFSVEGAIECLTPMLENVEHLYVTVCMDAFPASVAPGVSAPSALGISPQDTVQIIQWLGNQCRARGLKWVLSDIAELSPGFDIQGATARLAGRIGFELANAMHG
ncbi:formimidoylglutamase [Alteromonas aestuariivivens]|uniref:Formimidoylglutamase n=1 Tax=Alteromonas aestuariivivens TaxID=1938339 RepID=A0A3D8M8X2_9ALTE|nr:formimidoylglutamase [Alteromonas aestuariivivens]RDV26056.1 formimidoylglutamase [Alteromonas aestuariivivens]